MHYSRSALVLFTLTLAGCPGPQTPAPVMPPTVTAAPVARYSGNTPDATRDAHRQAIASLRNGDFAGACATLEGVPQSDRRSLTQYLTVLCTTRQPSEALRAEAAAELVGTIGQPPPLVDPELAALNRHRAWVAAIQDSMADAAQAHFNLPARPLPADLENSHDLARLTAYRQRGLRFDAATYNATFHALQSPDFATRMARDTLLANLDRMHANAVLFADLTGMHVPAPPALVLPADSDL